jgi:cold shock CspA family protein/ribosome-associated translation inhibitor RaiA
MSCRVIVEAMHKHHHKGNVYAIHIDITVPGKELAVSREPALDHAHEDIYVAIRDAFDAAKRRLQDHSAKVQKQVKAHETPLHGTVLMIHSSQDFGMIKTSDEREVYFHRNSLLNAKLEELEIGAKVRFHEEAGEKGAQASSIPARPRKTAARIIR